MMPGRRRRGSRVLWFVGMSAFLVILGLAKASEQLGAVAVPIWLATIAGAVVVLRGKPGEMLLTAIAVVYFFMIFPVTLFARRLEARLGRPDKRARSRSGFLPKLPRSTAQSRLANP